MQITGEERECQHRHVILKKNGVLICLECAQWKQFSPGKSVTQIRLVSLNGGKIVTEERVIHPSDKY